MYLYIHGFNSSSKSTKAQVFCQWLTEQDRASEWFCPDLPYQPKAALKLLSDLIEQSDTKPKLVGSSLGGFYATILSARYELKAVAINPAVHAGLVLREAVGPQTAWHDDSYQYEFTQEYVGELNAMDLLTPKYPELTLLMQETGDEVLGWQTAADYYRDCHQLIFRGGDHSFTRFREVLELIDRF